jgi:NAD(P)-dependent dehydrogenase (short-subunit alcohol dehydrogenase family)
MKNDSTPPVILLTGGSQGIGAACVQSFLTKNWKVATVALPGEGLDRWRKHGVLALEGDLTGEEVRRAAVDQTLEHFGRIDALVNNAGVGLYAPPSEMPVDLFRRMMEVNAMAPLALAQLVVPVMRRQGSGTIVNIGSVAGNVSMPWAVGYCASKFALHALNDSLRRELREEGIRVVKVCPGIVDTGFRRNVLAGEVPASLADLRPIMPAEKIAAAVVRAIGSRAQGTIYVPEIGRVFSAMQAFWPGLMDWYLARLVAKDKPAGHSISEPVPSPALEQRGNN